jgi:iron(III) transport system permease protein
MRPERTNLRGRLVLAGAVLPVVGGLVVVPLVRLVWIAFEGGGRSVSRVLRSPGLASAVAHSFELALVVTLVAVPVGTALALFLRHPDVPGRRLLRVVAVLPLVIPQFVLGFSWTAAYSRGGLADELTGLSWNGLTGPVGIAVVLVVDAVPLTYLLVSVGLATRAQPDLECAARVSGGRGPAILRTVTVPLLGPVLAACCVLTFVATLESFAVPQMLGAPSGYATLTTRIYADLSLGGDPGSFVDAVTLALGLVLLAAVILVPADLALPPRLTSERVPSNSATTVPPRTVTGVFGILVLAAYAVLAVALPTLGLVSAAVTKAIGLAPTPSNWTLANFRSALNGPAIEALWHSLQLAAGAACVVLVLGLSLALLDRRRGGRLLGTSAILAFTMPGSALAVGLLVAYERWMGGTLLLILLAYVAKFWALGHRGIAGALDRVPPGEWQAARVSGGTALTAARTVWLPALAPSLFGVWLLVFVTALHEVTMSSLLYSTGSQTLAVLVLNSQQLGDTATTAALSLILTILVGMAAALASILIGLAARRRAPTVIASAPEPVGVA